MYIALLVSLPYLEDQRNLVGRLAVLIVNVVYVQPFDLSTGVTPFLLFL